LSRVQQLGLGRRRLHGWSGRRLRRRIAWVAAVVLALATIVGGATWLATLTQSTGSNGEYTTTAPTINRNAIAEAGQIERDLENGFEVLRNEIQRVDSGTFYLQEPDHWARELESIHNDLSRIESMDN
jgi:hypothetical protein